MNLLNSTNIFVIFIALIVAFFLLGIIFGVLIHRSRKIHMEDTRKADEPIPEPIRTERSGQDNQEHRYNQELGHQQPNDSRNRYNQEFGQYQQPNNSRNRYYDNY
jgi:hypothetical protein